MNRNRILRFCFEEALEGCIGTLKIIQPAASHELVVKPQHRTLHAVVQEQVCIKDVLCLNPGLLSNHLNEYIRLLALLTEKGKHINLCIELISVINFSVHVDGKVRYDHEITVNVYKSGLNAFFRTDNYAACNRKRPVKPGRTYHSAVLFNIEFYILLIYGYLSIGLDLKYRRITMACHHLETCVILLRDAERYHSRIISCYVVAFSRLKLP